MGSLVVREYNRERAGSLLNFSESRSLSDNLLLYLVLGHVSLFSGKISPVHASFYGFEECEKMNGKGHSPSDYTH